MLQCRPSSEWSWQTSSNGDCRPGKGKDGPKGRSYRVWIGTFDRQNWKAYWAHNSLRISQGEGRYPWTVNPDGTPRPNTQTTTYVAGTLYIHAFTCPFPEILNSVKLTGPVDRALVQIWPIRHSFIAWQLAVLTDRQADTLAAHIFRSLDVSGKVFGI